jgi:hypothetical protein
VKNHITEFSQYISEGAKTRAIQDLPAGRERPMVDGIASILRKVRDVANRREIAKAQIREFKRDGIRFDYAEFLELCGL